MSTACDCKSYNGGFGNIPEVILPRPDFLPAGERAHGVPVDACIAAVVAELWRRGIATLSSCCGHGGKKLPHWPDGMRNPMIVLADGVNPADARRVLEGIDRRNWRIMQWRLAEISR